MLGDRPVPVVITLTASDGTPRTTTVEMTRKQYAELLSDGTIHFVQKRQRERFADFYRTLSKLDTLPRFAPKKNYFHEFMLKELTPQLGVSIPAELDETGSLYVNYREAEVFEWNGYLDKANTPGLARLWLARRKALSLADG